MKGTNMHKKFFALLGAVVTLALGVTALASSPASAGSGLLICTANGHGFCMNASSPLTSGEHIFADYSFNARAFTLSSAGGTCPTQPGYDDCIKEYIQFYNGDFLASTDDCGNYAVVKTGPNPTGDVWYDNEDRSAGVQLFQNQHCVGSGSFLYTDNVLYDHFKLDGGGTSGNYYRMKYIAP
jgi:hypothetical protein